MHDDNSCANLDDGRAEETRAAAQAPAQPTVVVAEPPSPAPDPPPVVRVVATEEPALALPPPPPEMAAKEQPPDVPPPSKLEVPPPVPAPEPLPLTEAAPVNVLPPPTESEPEVGDPLIDWHRGDIPMLRNWHKILGYQAVLAAALFAGKAGAQDKNSDGLDKADVKAIKSLLEKIDKKVGSIDGLKSDVGGLKKEIELMRQANGGAFRDMNDRITQLEAKLKGLESRLNQPPTRVANFPPTNGTAPPPTGRIRLLNNYGRPATVILNGLVHRLNPLQSQSVDVPLGPYTVEVLVDGYGSVQPPTTALLSANNPRTIEIFTR